MNSTCRKILLLMVIVAVFAVAPAVGEGKQEGPGAAAEEERVLNLWRPASSSRAEGAFWDDSSGKIFNTFQEKYPNIKVEIEDIPFEQYDTKQMTAIAGGNPPDIAFINHVTLGAVIDTGKLKPLDEWISGSDVVNPDDYIQGMYKLGNVQGKQYALPWDTDTRILYYNLNIFNEAGVQSPKYWADWLSVLEKIEGLDKPRTHGYSYFGGSYWGVLYQDLGPLMVQNDTSFLADSGKTVTVKSDATRRAFEFGVKLAQYAPAGAKTYEASDLDNLFAQGQLGTYVWGMWYKNTLNQLNPDYELGEDYDVRLIPYPEDTHPGSSNGGWQLGIFTDAKNKEDAWKLMEHVHQPDMMAIGTQNHIPTRIDSQEYEYFEGDPVVEMSLEQATYGRPPVYPVSGLPEIAQTTQKIFLKAVDGTYSVDEAINELDSEVSRIISE